MSTRTVLILACSLVLLFALVAGAIVWPEMRPRGFVINSERAGQGAQVRSGDLRDDSPEAGGGNAAKPGPGPKVITTGKTEEPRRAPYDTSKLDAGQILLRAQVKITSPGGLDTLAAADRLPCDLCLRHIDEKGEAADLYYTFDLDGIIETPCSIEDFPIENGVLASRAWSARICWNDVEGFAPIAAPKLQERVLDFGTIELDLSAALEEGEWLFIGRLLHPTGLPICGLDSLTLKIGDDEQNWIEQRENGRFVCDYWGDYNADVRVWLVHSYDEDETLQVLGKPEIRGRIVDLGDITVKCAAIEVHIDAWPDQQLRRQRRGLEANAELPEITADIYLSSINYSTEIAFASPETVKVGFAMPGPYRWSLYQSDETLAYADAGGEIMLEAGKLTRLDVAFVPVHSVLVHFKAAGELGDVRFEVQMINADGDADYWLSDQLGATRRTIAVPNPKRAKMVFTAAARGWVTIECEVAPETTALTIEFKERAPATTGILVVELPKLPEFFDHHPIEIGIFCEVMNAGSKQKQQLASYNSGSKYWGLTDEDKLLRFEVLPGEAKVWLQEVSQIYGYPRGMISGPVECTVTIDAPCKVKLPAFEAPPWSVAAQGSYPRLTCEGLPMNYHGPILDGANSRNYSLQYGNSLQLPAGDYTIPDGAQRHTLRMTLPTEQQQWLLFEYDFPARIEVRVRRGKSLVPSLISVSASLTDGTASANATSKENGKLRLWAPQGEVRLKAEVLGSLTSLFKTIVVGVDLTVVEFSVEGSYAQFDWDERYQTEPGCCWWLRDATGEIIDTLHSSTKSRKFEPGTYTLRPENANKPEISFSIAADSDLTLEIPFVPKIAYTGSFLVKYPKDLKPDPDGYAIEWFWYVPLSNDVAKDVQTREYATEYGWMRCTVDGLKFGELPANVEIVLALAVGALDDDDSFAPQAWAAAPMRLTLKGGEMETITVAWKRAVVLSSDWYDSAEFVWVGPDGAAMRFTQYNRIFLPGAYNAICHYGETPREFPVTLKLEADKFFDLTPEIRKFVSGEEGGDDGGD